MIRNADRKSFCNHKPNGVNLVFPNGNWISTIWGRGSYTENRDFGDDTDLWLTNQTLIEQGSSTVEIMIGTNNQRLYNSIYRKLQAAPDNRVIGHVKITEWLWVLNQLAK